VNRRLRRAHRLAVAALVGLLPAGYFAALRARPAPPGAAELPAALARPGPPSADAEGIALAWRGPAALSVAVGSSWNEPDTLAYVARTGPGADGTLPRDARLLAVLRPGEALELEVPDDARWFLVYGLARRELLITAELAGVEGQR
jgi:hypothetical protein